MLEIVGTFFVVVAAILVGRQINAHGILPKAFKVFASSAAVLGIFVIGVAVFLWNPINNETYRTWLSWSAILSNGATLAAAILGSWFSLRFVWKTSGKVPNQHQIGRASCRERGEISVV